MLMRNELSSRVGPPRTCCGRILAGPIRAFEEKEPDFLSPVDLNGARNDNLTT